MDTAKSINDKLKQLPEVINYLKIKKAILEDTEITLLMQDIKQTQKLLKDSLKSKDIVLYNSYKNKLKDLSNKFNSNPLIINYLNYRNDCADVLTEVLQIIAIQ